MNESEKHSNDCRWFAYGNEPDIPERFDHEFDVTRCKRCRYLDDAEYADRLLREHGCR